MKIVSNFRLLNEIQFYKQCQTFIQYLQQTEQLLLQNLCIAYPLFFFQLQQMINIILFIISIPILCKVKEPILQLPLNLNSNKQLETTFSLGPSEVRVQVDLNDKDINICCKYKNTLTAKIYYYMLNPFRPHQDYNCHIESNLAVQDVAKFSKIGPITVKFNQIVYPQCTVGNLGFSKQSDFLGILPKSQQFFIIQRQNGKLNERKKWKLRVGGAISDKAVYINTGNESQWSIQIQDISFNQISLGSQNIILISDIYQLSIPKLPLSVIQGQLVRNFQCAVKQQAIYCPCIRGISKAFPSFHLKVSNNATFKILPGDYLHEEDEICRIQIKQSSTSYWSVNVLMLDNTDLIFQYDNPRIGIVSHRLSIQTDDSIKQPLQIILNSVVILLMCLFVAMILIEVIKHFTGIQSAGSQSFENYMLKHTDE